MSNKGHLFVISAPSGAGKTTLVKRLLQSCPHLVLSISWTTRPPRAEECEGVDYHFVSTDEFLKAREAGVFLESEEVHGCYYGTPKQEVESRVREGLGVILDIDTKGALSVKKACSQAILFFLQTPSTKDLELRLRKRGTETEEEIQKRVKNAHQEMSAQKHFDYVITNDDLERALSELVGFVQSQSRA